MLGTSAIARITSVGRWSVFGDVIETLTSASVETQTPREETKPPCSSNVKTCETCDCSAESCCGDEKKSGEACNISGHVSRQDQSVRGGLLGWLMSRRNYKTQEKQELVTTPWGLIDKALVFGVFISSLTIVVLFISIASRVLLRQ